MHTHLCEEYILVVGNQFLPLPVHMKATQMRILELVRMPSSRAACGAALEGGNAVAKDDLTVSNIGQHTDESSSIFVAVRIRPGVKIRHNQKWKTVTAQPGGKQVNVCV